MRISSAPPPPCRRTRDAGGPLGTRAERSDGPGLYVAADSAAGMPPGATALALDAGAYPSGVYLVRVSTERGAEAVRFTVAR